jgi:hypothetical protein
VKSKKRASAMTSATMSEMSTAHESYSRANASQLEIKLPVNTPGFRRNRSW